jgi:UPF0755 protein
MSGTDNKPVPGTAPAPQQAAPTTPVPLGELRPEPRLPPSATAVPAEAVAAPAASESPEAPRRDQAPSRTEAPRTIRSARAKLAPEKLPRPTKGRRAASREWITFGSAFLSLLMVIGLGALIALYYGRSAFLAPGPLPEDRIVVIPRGQSLETTAESLERAGIIHDAQLFTWGVSLSGQRGQMRFGEYAFPARASMRQVLDLMVSGRVVQHPVTIPEGLTSFQIVQRLRGNELLSGEVREVPPEGSLLPETYLVPRGYARADLLRRMQQDQQRVLADIWARRRQDVPVRTPIELLTLASIVEKETGKAEERARVAGVFVNRLNRRMRLQSDPTIIYGLVGGQGSLGRPILRSEIERPTPFNTYVIPALPPGPIANPGRAALEAAANPMRHNEIYFVADGTGGHTFSETLEQHNRAVQRWREIERSRGSQVSPGLDVSPAAAPTPSRPQAPQPGQRQGLRQP